MEESIYGLITELCEKFSNNNPDVARKLRVKSYELLLNKRESKITKKFVDVYNSDPFIKLLVWQFLLGHQFGLFEHGKKLIVSAENLQKCYENNPNSFNNLLIFLLNLRNVPKNEDMSDIEDSSFFDIPQKYKKLYKSAFSGNKPQIFTRSSTPIRDNNCENIFFSLDKPCNCNNNWVFNEIWESVLKLPSNPRRSWENFGYSYPEKEKPFLTELGKLSSLWVENLPSVYIKKEMTMKIVRKTQIKSQESFIKDVKFLLVGLASDSFDYNENREIVLKPNLTLNGLTPESLEKFCKDFITTGNGYKLLYDISITDPYTGKYKRDGYIFAEFCMSIYRYLEHYRSVVFNLPDTVGLLKIHRLSQKLRDEIAVLVSISKLDPHKKSDEIPNGVALLNYLYLNILTQIDENLILVLYSVFFSCCRVYFFRFLQEWIAKGAIDDPFNEFFVKSERKFLCSRGRTFWTRSYYLREDMVPDFLLDLRLDILSCGKTMNLLRSCFPANKLCVYLNKNPLIVTCCTNSEQMTTLKQNVEIFVIEVSLEIGSKFNFDHVFSETIDFEVISKKRTVTLKRIELERMESILKVKERKQIEIEALKEQYDLALKQKQDGVAAKIEIGLKEMQADLSIESMRAEMINKMATEMIEYYDDLFEKSEKRKKAIETHIESLKNINLEHIIPDNSTPVTPNESPMSKSPEIEVGIPKIPSPTTLDAINANANATTPDNLRMDAENNRTSTEPEHQLTEAQRNKLRVLSSEFGLFNVVVPKVKRRNLTQMEINRNFNTKSNDCFRNCVSEAQRNKLRNLSTEFNLIPNEKQFGFDGTCDDKMAGDLKFESFKSPDGETIEKITEISDNSVPMSIDSTPLSEISPMVQSTASVLTLESPESAKIQIIDDDKIYNKSILSCKLIDKKSSREVLDSNRLRLFLQESVSVPLLTQKKFVDNEFLRVFINDLNYIKHLEALRDYFFLQDGEFGRNITENLFEKLYDAKFPTELINCRVLQRLVFDALDSSSKFPQICSTLSFRINNLPKCFDLGDPNVLDCLSLTYKIQWPLNILLPTDTISKYDQVFKYLLKVSRVSWVLKRIYMEMKILAKEMGEKEIYLMMSPQYRKVHQCRHIMLHFVQSLQNYIVGKVLQSSWEIFKVNLRLIDNFDDLYSTHTSYIKNILFLCLLNQKSAPLRKVLERIFVVILKFYDYLRSRSWYCEEGVYLHPNFIKLDCIFRNFEEIVLYFFKVCRKVVKSGYQPHLVELLNVLDINEYFSERNLSF